MVGAFFVFAKKQHLGGFKRLKMVCSPAARGGNLAKIPPIQVIGDFGRGSSVESESEWCPAGIIERFELFKMASNMATPY